MMQLHPFRSRKILPRKFAQNEFKTLATFDPLSVGNRGTQFTDGIPPTITSDRNSSADQLSSTYVPNLVSLHI